jgi:hypothetical protein
MIAVIHRNGLPHLELPIDERSTRTRRLMAEDIITLEVESHQPLDLQIGDYIENEGRYFLNTIPPVRKTGHQRYQYTAVFESQMYNLGKVQFLIFTDDPISPAPLSIFDLTGTAQLMLDQVLVNSNRIFSGWSIGGSVPATEHMTLHFEGDSCLAALHKICDAFGLEFSVSQYKELSIGFDLGVVHDRTFQYGRGKGLFELERLNQESKEVITRLYAFGSERNIPSDYRNYSPRLKLPNDFVEANTSVYGVVEHTEVFEDIYPTRKGTVSWVNPLGYLQFRDSGMDFDLNDYLLSGLTAKVHFISGNLAGYSIELNTYNHLDKEFTLLINKDEKDFEVPSENLKPEVGDQYVLLDIKMPQTYIDAAETALASRAQEFIEKYSSPQISYQLRIDPIYIQKYPISLSPGDWVRVGDNEISVNELVRIIGIKHPLTYPDRMEVELSENPTPSIEQQLYREQQKLATVISTANAKYASLSLLQAELGKLTGNFGSHNHDDRYYTQNYISQNYYTQSHIESNFAPTTHSHSQYLTEGQADLRYALILHSHSWTDITSKPTTFAPSAHGHSWSEIISTPTTLSGYGITDAASSTHTHTFSSLTSKPTTISGYGITDALVIGTTSTTATAGNRQITAVSGDGNSTLTLTRAAGNLTTNLAHNHDTVYAPILHSHSWTDISGKPSTFTPSVHGHSWSEIISTPTTLAGYGITDAATSTHTHTFSSLTSKPTTISGYGITDALVIGTTSTTATAGNRQITAVSGDGNSTLTLTRAAGNLTTNLAHNHDTVYAPILHSHSWTDISGKPSAPLRPAAHGHSWSRNYQHPHHAERVMV